MTRTASGRLLSASEIEKFHAEGYLVAEEVIRTLVGSVTLVLAVPIATAIAAYFASHGAKRPV